MPFDVQGAKDAGYSDADIAGFMAQQRPDFDYQGAKKAGYSDDEIASHLSSLPPIETTASKFAGNEDEIAGKWATGQMTAPSAALQTMGNVAQAGYDAAGNLIKKVPGYGYAKQAADAVGNAAQSGAQWVANKIDSPTTEAAATGVADTASDFAKNHPEITGDAAAIAKLLPLESSVNAVGSGLNAASESSEYNLAQQMAKKTGILPSTQAVMAERGIPMQAVGAMTPQQIAKVKNQMYAEGVSGSIQDARTAKNGIYSMATEVGNDDIFNAADTKAQLDALHSRYSQDPAYDGTPLARRLGSWKSMFNDDGTITPTRLNNLKDQVDDAYRENPKAPEGEVYQSISGPVNGAVDTAKQQFPNWGTLIGTADDAHYNLMKSTQDDSVFTNKWSPDSQKDFQIVANKTNKPSDLMGSTIQQINNMTNIKDETELQKVMSFMPQELQGQFLTDVAKNSAVPAKIKNLVKAALYTSRGNYGWGLQNALSAIPGASDIAAWDTDAATHISDRIAQWKDAASDAYQNHLDKKMAQQGMNAGTAYKAATAQRMLPAPPATPALPAPASDLQSGWPGQAGTTRPMTPAERDSAIAMRQANPNTAVHPGEAQPPAAYNDPRARNFSTEGGFKGDVLRENRTRPINTTQGAEYTPPSQTAAGKTLQDLAGPEYDDFLKRNGFAKGGAITEAQKRAGNYKKDHIKFQGLDISIENKKGSIRSGKDKGGKEWSVKMPAAYGYFKRSEGADGDHVDCYIGPHEKSNRVYVIDQQHHDTRKFDEHKCMLGFASRDEAIATYKSGFSDGKGAQRIGKVTRMSMADFKDWLKNGNTKKPMKEAA
jgi:hypothetical protein